MGPCPIRIKIISRREMYLHLPHRGKFHSPQANFTCLHISHAAGVFHSIRRPPCP